MHPFKVAPEQLSEASRRHFWQMLKLFASPIMSVKCNSNSTKEDFPETKRRKYGKESAKKQFVEMPNLSVNSRFLTISCFPLSCTIPCLDVLACFYFQPQKLIMPNAYSVKLSTFNRKNLKVK